MENEIHITLLQCSIDDLSEQVELLEEEKDFLLKLLKPSQLHIYDSWVNGEACPSQSDLDYLDSLYQGQRF